MKQSFGQKGAGGRFLALALALIMLCSVLVPAYAAAVDEQGTAENQNEPVPAGVTYIFHVGEAVYQQVKVLSGGVLTKPADPAPEAGKVFACWRLADGQEFTSFGTEVSTTKDETVALYAHFVDAQTDAPAQEPTAEPAAEPTPEEPKQDEPTPEEPKPEEPTTDEPVTPETPSEPEPETPETPENPQPDAPADVLPAEETPAEETPAEETPIVLPAEPVAPETLFAEIIACEDPVVLEQLLAQAADSAEFETYLESLSEDELIAYNEKLSLLTGGENELAVYAFNGVITSVKISDTIPLDGQLNLLVNGDKTITAESLVAAGYKIEWKRGTSTVERRVVTTLSDGTDRYNMDKFGQWVNVAYDEGASMTYTVTVSKDGETIGSDSYTVPYFDEIQNGSFEQPVLTGGMQLQTTYEANPSICWKTTAGDGLIEIVSTSATRKSDNSTYKDLAGRYHKMDHAHAGIQYAEINAEEAGALYQDVLTEPGAKMNWQVYHNGREGTDTMVVVIMATKDAENIKTQAQLLTAIQEIRENKYPGAVVTDNLYGYQGSWTKHSGEYTVPEGQYLTRYFFVAIDTAATGEKEDTIGNHIDNVWFSTELPPPAEGEGTLTIEKYIYGLDMQQVQSLKDGFISYREGNSDEQPVSFTNWRAGYDESGAACIIGSKEITVTGLGTKTYKVKEDTSEATLEGYTLQADTETEQTVELTRSDGNVKTVTFKNHYTPAEATLTIKKVVDGNMADHGKTFAFTYYYDGMEVFAENAKFELSHNGEKTLDVPYGTTITITETADGCDTNWSYTYKDANENDVVGSASDLVTSEDGNVKTCKLTVSANTTLTCTNTMHITPDTGIFLDSWPYFVALALVAAGAVLLFARRRRDAD